MKQFLIAATLLFTSIFVYSQQVQTIRGQVTDKESKTPLPGANVILLDVEPLTGTTTDIDGNFTNHKDVLTQLYSASTNSVTNVYQLGFFPMFQYPDTFLKHPGSLPELSFSRNTNL